VMSNRTPGKPKPVCIGGPRSDGLA
jgi:hypothetical protein